MGQKFGAGKLIQINSCHTWNCKRPLSTKLTQAQPGWSQCPRYLPRLHASSIVQWHAKGDPYVRMCNRRKQPEVIPSGRPHPPPKAPRPPFKNYTHKRTAVRHKTKKNYASFSWHFTHKAQQQHHQMEAQLGLLQTLQQPGRQFSFFPRERPTTRKGIPSFKAHQKKQKSDDEGPGRERVKVENRVCR